MKIINGDIIDIIENKEAEVIVHGCNCFCTMGAGIAKTLSSKYPEILEADKQTESGDIDKLGSYTKAVLPNGVIVLNAYTQYHYGNKSPQVNYDALRKVFKTIRNDFSDKSIAYPMIGSGLAGGDWDIIADIIFKALEGMDHTLIKFKRV